MIAPSWSVVERRGRETGEDRSADVNAGVEDDARRRPAASGFDDGHRQEADDAGSLPAVDHGGGDDRHDRERGGSRADVDALDRQRESLGRGRGGKQTGDTRDLGPGRRRRDERGDRRRDPDDSEDGDRDHDRQGANRVGLQRERRPPERRLASPLPPAAFLRTAVRDSLGAQIDRFLPEAAPRNSQRRWASPSMTPKPVKA